MGRERSSGVIKPKLKTYVARVQVQYWSCAIDGHRHQSEVVAAKCIARSERAAAYEVERAKKAGQAAMAVRFRVLLALSRAGYTNKEIAKLYDTHKERIRQSLVKAELWERDENL